MHEKSYANLVDKQYHELAEKVIKEGNFSGDRTGTGVKSIFGHQMRFKMNEGLPVVTTKSVYLKGVIGELLWFLGNHMNDTKYRKLPVDNIRYLLDNNINIWVGDCYKAYLKYIDDNSDSLDIVNWLYDDTLKLRPFTESEFIECIKVNDAFALKFGGIGAGYGWQWNNFNGDYDRYRRSFSEEAGFGEMTNKYFISNYGINQIDKLIEGLKNDPFGRRHLVTAWNPDDLGKTTLPPCFTENNDIYTKNGVKKIKDIIVGDSVLSHDGSFNEVYEKFETKYDGEILKFKIKGSIFDFTCTPNHPFLVKDIGFVEAKNISAGQYLGIPRIKKQILPNNIDNIYPNQKQIDLKDKNTWLVIGFLLSYGWICNKTSKIFFETNDNLKDDFLCKIKEIIPISKINEEANVYSCDVHHVQLNEILKDFGFNVTNKKIPDWVLFAPNEYIESFLNGYHNGCLYNNPSLNTAISSKELAFGIQLLHCKVGYVNVGYFALKKDIYSIMNEMYESADTGIITDDDVIWYQVLDVDRELYDGYVYNFSVSNTNTYTVNNIITHNCHYGFSCYVRELNEDERNKINSDNKPKYALSLMERQRSADLLLGVPFNITSYAILLQMIANEVGMVADELIMSLENVHIYSNHFEAFETQLSRDSIYELPRLEIANKNYRELIIDDFKIIDYKSHGTIKAPLNN